MFDGCFEGLEPRLFLSADSNDERGGADDATRETAAVRASPSPAKLSSHTDTRDIFGKDDRVRVRDTGQHPYAAVGQLDAWWDDGNGLSCTAAMVGRYHVLTAAHCVYDPANGGEADFVDFIAGRDGDEKPFGTVSGIDVRIDKNYPATESSADDYALVTLEEPLGDDTGWFGYGNYKTGSFERMAVNSAGYPGDRGGGDVMYRQSGRVSYASTYKIMSRIDVAQGQSGSPIYRKDNTIVGVLSASNTQYTYATRITGRRFERIENWIEKDQRKLAATETSAKMARALVSAGNERRSVFSDNRIDAAERATVFDEDDRAALFA